MTLHIQLVRMQRVEQGEAYNTHEGGCDKHDVNNGCPIHGVFLWFGHIEI